MTHFLCFSVSLARVRSQAVELPIDIFECGDVVVLDSSRPEGASNRRHLGLLHYGTTSGFDQIHGSLAMVMRQLDLAFVAPSKFAPHGDAAKRPTAYTVRAAENPTFLPQRSAEVVLDNGVVIGSFGVVHPNVLGHFGLEKNPVSVLDIDIEYLL